jgi:hypothetical protein
VLAIFDHTVAADATLHPDVIRITGEHQKFLIATVVAEDSGFAVPSLEE